MKHRALFLLSLVLSSLACTSILQHGLLAQPYNPPTRSSTNSYNRAGQDLSAGKSTAAGSVIGRTLAARAADMFNPKDYGAVGNNIAHTLGSTLGVTTLAGLAGYSSAYSWVTNSVYGLTFSLPTTQTAAGTTINYTLPTTNNQSAATATAYNYAAQADVVLPGMSVSGSCITPGTTVSAVATGLPFSITTSMLSSSGSTKIQMPFNGGITVGTTVQSNISGAVPSGAVVTAITPATPITTAYGSTTVGSNIVTWNGNGTMPTTANIGNILSPELRGDTGAWLLMFPPLTTITGITDSTHFTVSAKAYMSGGPYLPVAYSASPTITISTALGANIPAGTPIYFGGISQVTLSQTTPSACSNAAVTYTYSNSMIQSLDMDWLGIQSAVVAASSSVSGGGHVKIPTGSYNLSRMVALPFSGGQPSIAISGDGRLNTVLIAQQDTGRGTCALGENNRANGALSAVYNDFQLTLAGTSYLVGAEPSGMSGICMGEGSEAVETDVKGFHAGYDLLNDHQKILRSTAEYDWFGVEMAANSDKGGNQNFQDDEFLAEDFSSIAAAWNYGIDSAIITNTHTGFSPYGYYREGAPYGSYSGASFLTNTQLNNVAGEALGNGWLYGENGVSDVIAQNAFIETSPSIDPSRGYNIPSAGIPGVFVVGQFENNTFLSSNIDMNNGGGADDYRIVTCALICMKATNTLITNNKWVDSTSAQSMILGANVTLAGFTSAPIFVAQFAANNTWSTGNASGSLVNTDTAVTPGEVMAYSYSPYAAGTTPMTSGAVVRGVSVNAAAAGGVVAVAEQGLANVNATNYASTAAPAYMSTTTPTSVTTGTASDANTSVRVGIFLPGNQIVVRPSP